jgi:hypothetical protein
MEFIIMQFSPWSVSLPFRSRYLPKHCSEKSSVYVPPSEWQIKFRTHTAQVTNNLIFSFI